MRHRGAALISPVVAFGPSRIPFNDTPETDSQKYKTLSDQLIKDIAAVQPHITTLSQILERIQFLFYVFPFNDAPNEKVSIINELLTGCRLSEDSNSRNAARRALYRDIDKDEYLKRYTGIYYITTQ